MRADGNLINLPALGVTGHNWERCRAGFLPGSRGVPRADFHADDLVDCGWEPDFAFQVPNDLPSGVYGIELEAGAARGVVPLIVSAGRSRPATAQLAVLLPTSAISPTPTNTPRWQKPIDSTGDLGRLAAAVTPVDRYMAEQRLNSTYELHDDGSGTFYSSWRRPVLNFRADYSMPLVQGPHQFPADIELLRWLDAEEIAYEVLADDDLHRHGHAALANFRAIVTGSHPEYWSPPMLAGLDDYLAAGGSTRPPGRAWFLSGNHLPVRPDRHNRDPQGTVRDQSVGVGPRGRSTTPSRLNVAVYGGTGAGPRSVSTGVGFTAQGFDVSLPYRWAITWLTTLWLASSLRG